MTTPKVLPADIYDTLEFSALAFGGIGAGAWSTDGTIDSSNGGIPICIRGHCYAADAGGTAVLGPAHIGFVDNDIAVRTINGRKGAPVRERVTWKEYTKQMRLVRGD